MITYSFGDIVLIGFPYTDMKSISKRPALILFDSGDQDILVSKVCFLCERKQQSNSLTLDEYMSVRYC